MGLKDAEILQVRAKGYATASALQTLTNAIKNPGKKQFLTSFNTMTPKARTVHIIATLKNFATTLGLQGIKTIKEGRDVYVVSDYYGIAVMNDNTYRNIIDIDKEGKVLLGDKRL